MTSKRRRAATPNDATATRSKILKTLDHCVEDDTPSSETSKDSSLIRLVSASIETPVVENEKVSCVTDETSPVPSPELNGDSPSAEGGDFSSSPGIVVKDQDSPEVIFNQVVGKNPFSSMFPRHSSILAGALVITYSKFGDEYEFKPITPINILQEHRPTKALRLLKCASHTDNVSIVSPKGGIVNVGLADPAEYTMHSNGYLWSSHNKCWVVSSLIGQTTYYSSDGYRQVCVTPYAQGWYRFTAFLAQLCGHNTLLFQSFMGGITFNTSKFKTNGNTLGISMQSRQMGGKIAPIRGSTLGEGQEIPVYDGRSGFQLGNYWERPYTADVPRGSSVMLLFSIKKADLSASLKKAPNLPKGVKFVFYLNIVGIIVLDGPSEQFSRGPSPIQPLDVGVKSIVEYEEGSGIFREELEVTAIADEEEILDESFL